MIQKPEKIAKKKGRNGLLKLATKAKANRVIIPPEKEPKRVLSTGATSKKATKLAAGGWLPIALDAHYRDGRPEWGKERPVDRGFTSHSMGQACDRESVLICLGYRGEHFTSQLMRIFEMGHDVEARWKKRFEKLGVLLSVDDVVSRKIDPVIPKGIIDCKVRHPDGRTILVEIKSINRDGFRDLPKVSLDPHENFENLMAMQGKIGQRIHQYMVQVQSYLDMDSTEDALLLFECKDNNDVKDYNLVRNREFMNNVYERLKFLNLHRNARTVPPCTCVAPSKGAFCRHKSSEVVSIEEIHALSEVKI